MSAALCAFAGYAAAVLVLLRLARRTEPALVVVALSLPACVFGGVAAAFSAQRFNLWVFLSIYWCLAMGFVLAFGAAYKSLSLRILLDLLNRPDRRDEYQRLHDRYLVANSFQNRLSVLRDKGLVTVEDAQYGLSARGARLASQVRAVQRLFGITRSG